MLKRIFHLLDKSDNEHEDQRRLFLTFLGIALTILLVSAPLALEDLGKFVYFGFLGLLLILLAFAYMNHLWLAKISIPFVGFMIITRFIYGEGIHDEALGGYYFVLLVVGLMNGRRAMLLFGVLSTLAVILIGVAETNGWITTRFNPITESISVATTAFFLLGTDVPFFKVAPVLFN